MLVPSDLRLAIKLNWKRYVTCDHEYERHTIYTLDRNYTSLVCKKCGRRRKFNYSLVIR